MRRVASLTSGILLVAGALFAQPPAQGAPQKIGIAAGLQRAYATAKMNLTQGAEKMPEADYTFQPTKDIRTFGQLYGHVANAQFGTCAAVKGVPNPNQGNDNEKKTTKAEFVKALADSFAFCDDAYSSLTDENAAQLIKQGQNEIARAAALSNNLTHDNEMYGISTVYLRLKGLVPPSTERQMQSRGGRGGQ